MGTWGDGLRDGDAQLDYLLEHAQHWQREVAGLAEAPPTEARALVAAR